MNFTGEVKGKIRQGVGDKLGKAFTALQEDVRRSISTG